MSTDVIIEDEVVDVVLNRMYKHFSYIYNNVLRESITKQEARELVQSVVFETQYNNPKASNQELVGLAIKGCRKELWGKGSENFDNITRNKTSTPRQRVFASNILVYNGQEVLPAEFWPVDVKVTNFPVFDFEADVNLRDLYHIISSSCGHEAAILFILHKGYSVSLLNLVETLFNYESLAEKHKIKQRIHRLMKTVATITKEGIDANRESRKLLNVER